MGIGTHNTLTIDVFSHVSETIVFIYNIVLVWHYNSHFVNIITKQKSMLMIMHLK